MTGDFDFIAQGADNKTLKKENLVLRKDNAVLKDDNIVLNMDNRNLKAVEK